MITLSHEEYQEKLKEAARGLYYLATGSWPSAAWHKNTDSYQEYLDKGNFILSVLGIKEAAPPAVPVARCPDCNGVGVKLGLGQYFSQARTCKACGGSGIKPTYPIELKQP